MERRRGDHEEESVKKRRKTKQVNLPKASALTSPNPPRYAGSREQEVKELDYAFPQGSSALRIFYFSYISRFNYIKE